MAKKLQFTEDSRVKIPVILQLVRLGYTYMPEKEWKQQREPQTNILREVFAEAYVRLNADKTKEDALRYIDNVLVPMLNNNDLGQQFYKKLVAQSTGEVLVDFDNFDNNTFHVATEVDCTNEDDSFRPDVMVFVNGLPLAFYEVKKPNSSKQMALERDRMGERNANERFRRFMNVAQLMLFSGDQEYVDTNKWQGSFYCTTSLSTPKFNYLREKPEVAFEPRVYHEEVSPEVIFAVLKDTKHIGYDKTKEFAAAIDPSRPAARFAVSLLARERFAFMLRFGIAFVNKVKDGAVDMQKHIMRYPQLFASLRLRKHLDMGHTKGTIWHTQGSGKTALAYHTVKNLTAYYTEKGIVPKFFFVVDRLDLANQACKEFRARGLHIVRAESREKFDQLLRNQGGIVGDGGVDEINVVNIQRFETDGGKIEVPYGTNIVRVFFIDEAHRSYKPKGSFLGALLKVRENSLYIGLTGTPKLAAPGEHESREAFLKREKSTRDIFGGYIDTYYYNQSIRDGYTLRLLHEVIETQYRVMLEDVLEKVKIIVGDAKDKETLYSHKNFVTPLTKYIVTDLLNAKKLDDSIGGMVVCDSSKQAVAMKNVLDEQHPELKTALILHNVGTPEEREQWTDQFKNGELDLLVVYNMLLTGFDAPRLKKLYMGRIVKEHNLLQTLARVNRPYGNWTHGHVVDFADIRQAFDAANNAYLDELKKELGDEWNSFDHLFRTREEIEQCVYKIREYLGLYNPDNLVEFGNLLDGAEKKDLQHLRRTLAEAHELKASIIGGEYEMSTEEIDRFIRMEKMVCERLSVLYAEEAMARGEETAELLNAALDSCLFAFKSKGDPTELKIADELIDKYRRAHGHLGGCFDPKDPVWGNLKDELKRIFGDKGFAEMSAEQLKARLAEMDELEKKIKKYMQQERLVLAQYNHDAKYARLHRYLLRTYPELTAYQQKLVELLKEIKSEVDEMLENDANLVYSRDYFKEEVASTIWRTLRGYTTPKLTPAQTDDMALKLFNEYNTLMPA